MELYSIRIRNSSVSSGHRDNFALAFVPCWRRVYLRKHEYKTEISLAPSLFPSLLECSKNSHNTFWCSSAAKGTLGNSRPYLCSCIIWLFVPVCCSYGFILLDILYWYRVWTNVLRKKPSKVGNGRLAGPKWLKNGGPTSVLMVVALTPLARLVTTSIGLFIRTRLGNLIK